jgi:GNAT superfamily N-acetyltransferase
MRLAKPQRAIRVRLAELRDKGAVRGLACQSHAASAFSNLPFSDEKFSRIFARGLDEAGAAIPLVAEHAGRVVGFLYATLGEYFVAEGRVISVHAIAVDQSTRGSLLGGRIALRLVKGVAQWGREQRASHVLFHVTSGIAPGRADAFFRKLGMTTLGGNYAFLVS